MCAMALASSLVCYNISDQQQSQRKRSIPSSSTATKMQYVNVNNASSACGGGGAGGGGVSANVFGGGELSTAISRSATVSHHHQQQPASVVHYPTYQNIVANSAAFMKASFCDVTPPSRLTHPAATSSVSITSLPAVASASCDSNNTNTLTAMVDTPVPAVREPAGVVAATCANVHPSPATDSVQQAYLRGAYSRLRQSGWYYEKCDAAVATELLYRTEPGTFLVRDSAHAQFRFSISMQTQRGPTSLRVAWNDDSASFYVDVDQLQTPLLPRFNCVIRLVSWLVAMSQSGSGSGSSTMTSAEWGGGEGNKAPVAILEIADDKNAIPVLLKRPLLHTILPLTALCRKAVHACRLRDRVHDKQLIRFLDQYPYSL